MFIPTHWIFASYGLYAVSDLNSLSRSSLLRVLLKVQYLLHFRRSLQNSLVYLAVISTRSGLLDPSILLMVSYSCFRVAIFMTALVCRFLRNFPLCSCVQRDSKFSEGLLCNDRQFTGNYSPCLIACTPVTKKVSAGNIPCYP